ncbi:hypothetical protein TRIUR3_20547 [Triticum urartu]|uniref:Uncharacterized protein n=1 Tax=Triticum urartu TaxID=4572 RepID=M8A9W9_TRIUA|nr:hypothetical protein TRIUR3_20547 [Triticum urartu]
MNFHDVHTLQQALDVAPPPRLRTAQDRAEHAERQNRLLVAHEDERVMAEWRQQHRRTYPTSKPTGQGAARRRRKGAALSGWTGVGGRPWRYPNMWLDTLDQTSEDGDDDDDDGDDDWE